ncbi:MAG: PGF-pre-PGF domain-containing protein [Candidatus Woesearchaeota archaeon]
MNKSIKYTLTLILLLSIILLISLTSDVYATNRMNAYTDAEIRTCSCIESINTIIVENNDIYSRSYEVNIYNNEISKWVTIAPYIFKLDSGESIDLYQHIKVPCFYDKGSYGHKIQIISSSGEVKELNQNVIIQNCQNLEVIPLTNSQKICGCDKAEYEIQINNVGFFKEEYKVYINSFNDASATDQNPLIIDPGAGKITTLSIDPSCEDVGNYSIEASVLATQSKFLTKFPLDLQVDNCYDYDVKLGEVLSAQSQASNNDFKEISYDYDICESLPVKIPVKIDNPGPIENSYEIEISPIDDILSLDTNKVSIGSGKSQLVYLNVKPPVGDEYSRTYSIDIKSDIGKISKSLSLPLNIENCFIPKIGRGSKRIKVSYSESITSIPIRNSGNKLADYELSLETDQPWISSQQKFVALAPSESTSFSIMTKPSENTPPGNYLVKLNVKSSNNIVYVQPFIISLKKSNAIIDFISIFWIYLIIALIILIVVLIILSLSKDIVKKSKLKKIAEKAQIMEKVKKVKSVIKKEVKKEPKKDVKKEPEKIIKEEVARKKYKVEIWHIILVIVIAIVAAVLIYVFLAYPIAPFFKSLFVPVNETTAATVEEVTTTEVAAIEPPLTSKIGILYEKIKGVIGTLKDTIFGYFKSAYNFVLLYKWFFLAGITLLLLIIIILIFRRPLLRFSRKTSGKIRVRYSKWRVKRARKKELNKKNREKKRLEKEKKRIEQEKKRKELIKNVEKKPLKRAKAGPVKKLVLKDTKEEKKRPPVWPVFLIILIAIIVTAFYYMNMLPFLPYENVTATTAIEIVETTTLAETTTTLIETTTSSLVDVTTTSGPLTTSTTLSGENIGFLQTLSGSLNNVITPVRTMINDYFPYIIAGIIVLVLLIILIKVISFISKWPKKEKPVIPEKKDEIRKDETIKAEIKKGQNIEPKKLVEKQVKKDEKMQIGPEIVEPKIWPALLFLLVLLAILIALIYYIHKKIGILNILSFLYGIVKSIFFGAWSIINFILLFLMNNLTYIIIGILIVIILIIIRSYVKRRSSAYYFEKSLSTYSVGDDVTIPVNEKIGIGEISFRIRSRISNASISIKGLKKKPTFIRPSPHVYRYFEIDAKNISENNLSNVLLRFRVKKSWIVYQDIDPKSIIIKRYEKRQWIDISTKIIDEDDSFLYFETKLPDFSYYAIAGLMREKPVILEKKPIIELKKIEKPVEKTVIVAPKKITEKPKEKIIREKKPKKEDDLQWPIYLLILVIIAVIVSLVYYNYDTISSLITPTAETALSSAEITSTTMIVTTLVTIPEKPTTTIEEFRTDEILSSISDGRYKYNAEGKVVNTESNAILSNDEFADLLIKNMVDIIVKTRLSVNELNNLIRILSVNKTIIDEKGIPIQVWNFDENRSLDLSQYFIDPDGDKLVYSAESTDHINIDIDNELGIAKLIHDPGFSGAETVVFTADDGKGGVVESNEVLLIVKKAPDVPISEKIKEDLNDFLGKIKESASLIISKPASFFIDYLNYIIAGLVIVFIIILFVKYNDKILDFLDENNNKKEKEKDNKSSKKDKNSKK